MVSGGKTIVHDRVAYGEAYALGEMRDVAINQEIKGQLAKIDGIFDQI